MASSDRKILMLLSLKDLIDDNVTADDIIKALRAMEKQRQRKRQNYVPTGKPRGRQKKDPMIYTGDL